MTKILTNSDVFRIMESWAPRTLSYDWDNVGLQVGSYTTPVKKVMITLDVVDAVVDEAIEKDVDLIIAHHPMLFRPINQINMDTNEGRLIQKLIKHNISVYASHTNLDAADGGVNDMLCDLLEIDSREILVDTHSEKLYKVVVYSPSTHTPQVFEAISNAGAGHIGNYSHCSFQTVGKGTFKPLEGTNPFIGSPNELEKVNEVKIETIVQQERLSTVIKNMKEAHPYEEVAYDVYALENQGKPYGIGRVGTINETITLETFCEQVKKAFHVPFVRVTGDLTKKVKKIAILGGSGEKYIHAAKKKGADVYITGDMTFHAAQDAYNMGLSIIDPGHHVEEVMKDGTKNYLKEKLKDQRIDIITSDISTEPFKFV